MKAAIALLLLGLVQVQGAPDGPEGGSQLQQLLPASPLAEGGVVREAREARWQKKKQKKGGKERSGNTKKRGKGKGKGKKGGKARRQKNNNKKNARRGRQKKKLRNGIKNKGSNGKVNRNNKEAAVQNCTCLMFNLTRANSQAGTQIRQLARIKTWCKRIGNASIKAATEFQKIVKDFNKATDNGITCAGDLITPAEKDLLTTLENCNKTVPEICNAKEICDNSMTLRDLCAPLLETFTKDYKKSFFDGATCATVCALLEAPKADGMTLAEQEANLISLSCLPNTFKVLRADVLAIKDSCFSASTMGSAKMCRQTKAAAWPVIFDCVTGEAASAATDAASVISAEAAETTSAMVAAETTAAVVAAETTAAASTAAGTTAAATTAAATTAAVTTAAATTAAATTAATTTA